MKYTCEYCGYVYDTEEECKTCEEFHTEPAAIHAGIFKPMVQTDNKYLDRVVLRMKDDVLAQYAFEGIIDQNIPVVDPHHVENHDTEGEQ